MGNCLLNTRQDATEKLRASPEEDKNRGNSLFSQGKYKEASEVYRMCIKSDPRNSVYYSNNAICCYKLKLFDECFKSALSGYKIDKRNVKALILCVKAKVALSLEGNVMDWEESLALCNHFSMFENIKGSEGDFLYGKRLMMKVRSLEMHVKTLEIRNRLLKYYQNNAQSLIGKIKSVLCNKTVCSNSVICPLTLEVFDQPVNISSGNTFEWKMVKSLIVSTSVDPLTREKFNPDKIIENQAVFKAVIWYIQHSHNPLDYFT